MHHLVQWLGRPPTLHILADAFRVSEHGHDQRRLLALIEATSDFVAFTDAHCNIVYLNRAARALLGIPPEASLQGRFIPPWLPASAAEIVEKEAVPTADREGVWRGAASLLDHAGNELPVSLVVVAHKNKDGTVTHYSTIARDISDIKTASDAQTRAAQELMRSNRELEQFAYVTSHDLQEPLRIIAGYLQLIERRYRPLLDEEGVEFIDFAVEASRRMQALINDLLAFSRVGTRGKPFVEVDLNAVAEGAVNSLRRELDAAGAEVRVEPLPTVLADPGQMLQLLQNLVGNAVKFRHPERKALVEIGARLEGSEWTCWVRDNGIGVAPQYFERIFLIFQRLHARDRYPGTGVGLALCKKIVERHGGRVWIESEHGSGTTLFFTLSAQGG